jgi:hypothetical protein
LRRIRLGVGRGKPAWARWGEFYPVVSAAGQPSLADEVEFLFETGVVAEERGEGRGQNRAAAVGVVAVDGYAAAGAALVYEDALDVAPREDAAAAEWTAQHQGGLAEFYPDGE